MLAGGFLFHLFRALRRAFGRLVLLFFVTGLIAAVLVELTAIYESGGQFPSRLTHLIALLLGLAVGYSVSMTLMVVELIRDLFLTVDEMEHDFMSKLQSGSQLMDDLVEGGAVNLLDGAVHRVFDRS